jgi:hypothetical protein
MRMVPLRGMSGRALRGMSSPVSIVRQADLVSDGPASGWYGVRCVFDWGQSDLDDDSARHTYEERITVWQAEDIDAAISLAEIEAREYADLLDGRVRWTLTGVSDGRRPRSWSRGVLPRPAQRPGHEPVP